MNTQNSSPAPKILVIDDEMAMLFLLEGQLTRAGYSVATAASGPEGLQKATEFLPDLILLDLMMPRMDGFEVCYRIRQHPALVDTPVIFLTASMTRENKLRAFAAGADDYVVKPFKSDELLARVTAVLKRRAQKSEGNGRVVSFFGVQPRAGTTTLAVQYSEALGTQHGHNVVLIDLAGSTGQIAPLLQLYSEPSIEDVLTQPAFTGDPVKILALAQRHRANCWVLPAAIDANRADGLSTGLRTMLAALTAAGYHVVIDAGSTLDALALAALQQSEVTHLITAEGVHGNRQLNTFLAAAAGHTLDSRRLRTVVNDVHGLGEAPVVDATAHACIRQASEQQRPFLWLQDQGIGSLLLSALS